MEGLSTAAGSAAALPDDVYVGPRPFRMGQSLFGRERETSEIISLLISRRLVLLHSPSGAGKTSLIQAAIIPAMMRRRFETPMKADECDGPIQPAVVRVNREPESDDPPGANRYLLSALLSLDLHRPIARRRTVAELAALTFDQYLEEAFPAASRDHSDDQADGVTFRPLLLVFDQFEELVTLDPTDEEAKVAFMRQVGQALENRGRWALFVIREDYLGAIEPLATLIPSRLATTYHLDLLRADAAVAAIRSPANAAGVTYSPGVIEALVDDLRQVRVHDRQGVGRVKPGLYVEPVHMQVVCQSLWRVKGDSRVITGEHLRQLGGGRGSGVDDVLANYYAMTVASVARDGGVRERTLRDWFSRQLIGVQRLRRPVLIDDAQTYGLTIECLDMLDRAFLIRREQRGGAWWFELAHDRLIAPVVKDNEAWQRVHLSTFQMRAELWNERDRPAELLLSSESLAEAERQVAADPDGTTEIEREFIEESRDALLAAENERERQDARRRLRRLQVAFGAGLMLITLLTLTITLTTSLAIRASRAERKYAWQAFAGQIGSAQNNWEEGAVNLAWQSLEETDPALRGWEFDYLHALFSHDARTFSGHGATLLKRQGHRESVTQTVARPRRGQLLSASEDSAIKIWDLATRQVRDTLTTPGSAVNALALDDDVDDDDDNDDDDECLVSVCDDGTIVIWNAEKDGFRVAQTIRDAHDDAIDGVIWCADQASFVTAGRDGVLKIWRRRTTAAGSEVTNGFTAADGLAAANGLTVADDPDGARRAADAPFDLATTLRGHGGWVTSVSRMPDGRIVSGGTDDTVRIWNVATGTLEETLGTRHGSVTSLTCDRQGRWIAAGCLRAIVIWDARTLQPIAAAPTQHDTVTCLDFAPNEERLVTGFRSGTVVFWEVERFTATNWFKAHNGIIRDVSFSVAGDETTFYTAAVDGLIKGWSGVPEPDPVPLQDGFGPVWGVVYSPIPNQPWFATAHSDGRLCLWDAARRTVRQTLTGHSRGIWSIAVSGDGKQLATGGRDHQILLWDVTAEKLRHRLDGRAIITAVSFIPGTTHLASAGRDGYVRLWDTTDGRELRAFRADSGGLNDVNASPDGRHFATSGDSDPPRIWDAASGALVRTLGPSVGSVYSVAWSPDGARIATGGQDRAVRIWDAQRGRMLNLLSGHTAWVTRVVFHPQGQRLVSCSQDNTIKLWELTSGLETLTLHDHRDSIWGLTFSPDGRRLLSCGNDWTIRVRDAGQHISTRKD